MAVTRLKRKDRKNKARANNRIERIKHLLIKPVVKHVDMDELRAKYGTGSTDSSEKKSASKSADSAKGSKVAKEKTDTGLGEGIVAEHNDNANRSKDEQAVEPEMTSAGSEDKE